MLRTNSPPSCLANDVAHFPVKWTQSCFTSYLLWCPVWGIHFAILLWPFTFHVIFILQMPRQFRFTVPLKPIAALCNEDDTVVCKNKWFFCSSFKLAGSEKKENVIFFNCVWFAKNTDVKEVFRMKTCFKKKCLKIRSLFFSVCRSAAGLRVNGSFENYFTFQEMSRLTLIYRLKAALNTMIHYLNTVNWIWYSGHSLAAVKNDPRYNLNGRWCVTSEIQWHSVILSTKKKIHNVKKMIKSKACITKSWASDMKATAK